MKLFTSQFDFPPHLVNILFLSTILELRKETFYKHCTSCRVAACHSNPISNALLHVKPYLQISRSNLHFRAFFSVPEIVFSFFDLPVKPIHTWTFILTCWKIIIQLIVFFSFYIYFCTYCLFIKSDPLVIHFCQCCTYTR